jgi:uncharacterized protein YqjF (DUF2071 family)
MVQRWMLISFLHWRVDAAELRPLVPDALEIDEFDGSAWVGLVPFRMTTHVPGLPAFPWISTFPETNVRTYVTGPDGGRGIWFFSLDVARSATAVAGAALGLPYRWSSMRIDGGFGDVTYRCSRLIPTGSVGSTAKVVSTAGPVPMTAREHFLVSRFRLYWTVPGGGLFTLDVEHEPLTLHAGRTPTLDDGLVEVAGIRRAIDGPITHHALGVTHVRVGAPRRLSPLRTRVPARYGAKGSRRQNMETVERSIEVDVPVRTAYNQWTQFEEFPRFMEGVESVEQLDDTRVRWVADVAGERKECVAEITEQKPDELVAWMGFGEADNMGRVFFAPLPNGGTRIEVKIDYEPQGAKEKVGDWFGIADRRLGGDLEQFREFIESRGRETGAWRGEIHEGREEMPPTGTER